MRMGRESSAFGPAGQPANPLATVPHTWRNTTEAVRKHLGGLDHRIGGMPTDCGC